MVDFYGFDKICMQSLLGKKKIKVLLLVQGIFIPTPGDDQQPNSTSEKGDAC
jgi:hypothetical protein